MPFSTQNVEGTQSKGYKKSYKKGKLTVKKLYNMLKAYKKADRPEVKISDTSYTTASALDISDTLTDSQILVLNRLAQGSDYFERVGDQVRSLSVHIKGRFLRSDSYQSIRMILVVVKENPTNGSTTDIATSYFVGNTPSVDAPKGWLKRHNYHVLADVRLEMTSTGDSDVVLIDRYIKIPKRYQLTRYSNTNANKGTVINNALYCMFISDSGANPNPDFVGNIRYRFVDA